MSEKGPEKIKIGFVVENVLGGVISVVLGLIELLDRDRFEFKVGLLSYRWRDFPTTEHAFRKIGIEPYFVTISHEENKYKVLDRFQKEFISSLDLLVSGYQDEMVAYCIGRLKVAHVMIVHQDDPDETGIAKHFSGIIDYYTPISEKVERNLKSVFDRDEWKRIERRPHAIPELDLPVANPRSERFTVLFVGRFTHWKGYDKVQRIGELLKDAGCDLDFVFVTNGVGESEFRGAWPYHHSTTFLSKIPNPEVQRLMAEANVVLMPSRSEGFPVALVEAMRRGLVPVCSDLETAFPELVDHGLNGYMFNLEDMEGFRDAIIRLKDERDLLASMSEAAIRKVKDRFDPIRNAAAYQDTFLKAIAEPRKRHFPEYLNRLGRLDRPYIPDFLFRIIKKMLR